MASRGGILLLAVIIIIVLVLLYLWYSAPAAVPAVSDTPVAAAPKQKKTTEPAKTTTTTAPKPAPVVVAAPSAPITSTATKPATTTTKPATTTTKPAADPISVTFYTDRNFAGKSLVLPIGKKSLKGTDVANAVSSIRVPAGARVVVYDKSDCTGKSATYTSDVTTLKNTGLNDDIACVDISRAPVVVAAPSAPITSTATKPATTTTKPATTTTKPATTTTNPATTTTNPATTTTKPATTKPATTKPATTKPAAVPISVTFYTDRNFAGKSLVLPIGKKSLKGTDVANAVSSIRVPAGARVVVYDKSDCTGKSATYTSDVTTLKNTGLNDDIACVDISRASESFMPTLYMPMYHCNKLGVCRWT